MTSVVIDNSVFMAWCLGDEDEPTAILAMQRVADDGGIAPRIWWYELRNALLMSERRGWISPQQVLATLADTVALAIEIDENHNEASILSLTRQHELSVYDAAYLEVALRRNLPLATLDRRLREAAETMGVAVVRSRD